MKLGAKKELRMSMGERRVDEREGGEWSGMFEDDESDEEG
jgi:hypothetical protein